MARFKEEKHICSNGFNWLAYHSMGHRKMKIKSEKRSVAEIFEPVSKNKTFPGKLPLPSVVSFELRSV